MTPLARLLVSPIPNPGLDPVSHFVDGFDTTLQFRGGTDRYTVLSTLDFIPFNEVALVAQGGRETVQIDPMHLGRGHGSM